MAELSALRARLKDRQVKEGALGTAEASICLDLSLLNDLAGLEAEREALTDETVGDPHSLVGARKIPKDLTEFDERIESKKAEIRENSITVKFRALSSVKYQQILNGFDDPDKDDQQAFLDALCSECYLETVSDGQKVDLTWDEIQPETSFGELDEIRVKVFALNRRRQDIPFSLKPSGKTR